jgi:glutamine amidotransferase
VISIVDYKAGNLTSVKLALDALGVESRITADPRVIRSSDRVVFPGVGAAGAGMKALDEAKLAPVLREVIEGGTPFLGVCFGMQLLFERSEEDGGTDCLGLIGGDVRLFMPANPLDKIPHMGWNAVRHVQSHPLFAGIEDQSEFYFVHSYYCAPRVASEIFGRTEYADTDFASVVGRGNIFATQFHPERSGRIGLRLYENFTRWDGQTGC